MIPFLNFNEVPVFNSLMASNTLSAPLQETTIAPAEAASRRPHEMIQQAGEVHRSAGNCHPPANGMHQQQPSQ